MRQVFIELFSYNDRWLNLDPAARAQFTEGVLTAVNQQRNDGVEVVGWGFNDMSTDRRAPYDFYCVYVTPTAEYQRGFEAMIAAAGWYEYFDQVNVRGDLSTPDALLQSFARLETANGSST